VWGGIWFAAEDVPTATDLMHRRIQEPAAPQSDETHLIEPRVVKLTRPSSP
jgi:hypothetical protein